MPVSKRGSLLAGTAALLSLWASGLGCQTRPIADHDAFALPSGGQPAKPPLFSFARRNAAVPAAGSAAAPSNNALPVIAGFTPAPAPAPAPAATPVRFHAMPFGQQPMNSPQVIASSWAPVRRVSAQQPELGAEWNGAVPAVLPPTGDDKAPAGDAMLSQPRKLRPTPAPVYAATLPAMHIPNPPMPREFEKMSLPPYVVEPPDILLIQASDAITLRLQRLEGQHLVSPDGMINLGIYGKIRVVGMTLDQVADAVAERLLEIMPGLQKGAKDEEGKEIVWKDHFSTIQDIKRELQVDVLIYNSKVYYVITDGGGYGQQIYPIPITGNETVLDALAKVNGLPAVASKRHIWVARATRAGQAPKILPVDWRAVTQCGSGATNYQIFPGDRVYVQSDAWIRADTFLAKRLSPILRGFGATLLGASTVNVIKNGGTFGGLGALSGIR